MEHESSPAIGSSPIVRGSCPPWLGIVRIRRVGLIRIVGSLILVLVSSGVCLPQAPDTLWTRSYGDGAAFSAVQTLDGGFVATGLSYSGHDSVQVLRTDSGGNPIWKRIYGSGAGYSVREVSNGGFVVAGLSSIAALIRLNFDGDTLWTSSITSTGARANGVEEASDGSFVVTGGSGGLFLALVSSSGAVQWIRFIGSDEGLNSSIGYSAMETSDGGFVVGGWGSTGSPAFSDAWVIRTSSTGSTIWSRLIHGSPSRDEGRSIVQAQDGGFAFVGLVGNFNLWLVRLDQAGDTLWTRTDTTFGIGNGLIEDEGGFIYVGPSLGDIGIAKTDSTGQLEWTGQIGGGEEDNGYSIAPTNDGGYIVAANLDCMRQEAGCYPPHFALVRLSPPTSGTPGGGIPSRQVPILKVFPNPMTSEAYLEFHLAVAGQVEARILDAAGRVQNVFFSGFLAKGPQRIRWDTSCLGSGVFFCGLRSGSAKVWTKCAKVK